VMPCTLGRVMRTMKKTALTEGVCSWWSLLETTVCISPHTVEICTPRETTSIKVEPGISYSQSVWVYVGEVEEAKKRAATGAARRGVSTSTPTRTLIQL
jgi:hypothetical protein